MPFMLVLVQCAVPQVSSAHFVKPTICGCIERRVRVVAVPAGGVVERALHVAHELAHGGRMFKIASQSNGLTTCYCRKDICLVP